MTYSAKLLKNYYEKEHNKIIFHNGMNLNQLAMEMWEKLGYGGVDASVLSRVIHGKRLFTLKQLEIFCALLGLKKQAKADLYYTLEEDYLHRHGLTIFPLQVSPIDYADIFSSQLKKLNNMRERGFLQMTIDWADELTDQIDRYYKYEKNSLYRDKLLSLLGNIMYEKGYAAGSIFYPEKNMRVILPLVKKQIVIARLINEPQSEAKAYVIQAFAYYALGKYSQKTQYMDFYKKSLSITKKALMMSNLSDKLQLIFWRYVALNSIYLLDRSGFTKAKKEIRRIINRHNSNSHFSYIVWALDSIARGQAYFDRSKALDTVLESKSFNQKIKWRDPLRETATIRNELEILRKLKSKDHFYIKKQAKKGLMLSSDYGIYRYKKYFSNFLPNFC